MKFIVVVLSLCIALVMAQLKIFKIAEPRHTRVECKNGTAYKNCECPNEKFNLSCMIVVDKEDEEPVCISNSTFFDVLPNCMKDSPQLRNEVDSFIRSKSTTISNDEIIYWWSASDGDSNRKDNSNSDSDNSSDSDESTDSSNIRWVRSA